MTTCTRASLSIVSAQLIHKRSSIEYFGPGVLNTGRAWHSRFLVHLELGNSEKCPRQADIAEGL